LKHALANVFAYPIGRFLQLDVGPLGNGFQHAIFDREARASSRSLATRGQLGAEGKWCKV
jgi:hypothetical protein